MSSCGLDHNACVELSFFIKLQCCLISEQETVSLKALGTDKVLINEFSSSRCFFSAIADCGS